MKEGREERKKDGRKERMVRIKEGQENGKEGKKVRTGGRKEGREEGKKDERKERRMRRKERRMRGKS